MKAQKIVAIAGIPVTAGLILMLAGCGESQGERGLTGAGIGAGVGAVGSALVGGSVGGGALVGGAVGAATGALTSPNTINLGRPW